jgi:phytoene desaturase (3,4-didehydrolycopene-forming)
VGKRLGIQYLFNSPVDSVILSKDQKTVEGVKLENGKELRADLVVINADLVYAYNNLLPPTNYARSLKTRGASCSSISFFWSLDSTIPELEVHNIFLADQYSESFDAIFKKYSLPEDPSFYVNVPSRIDKSAAPPNKDAVVVLVPIGHLLDDKSDAKDWNAVVENTRNLIIDTIEKRTGARNLRERIVHEDVNTPTIWREKFNLDRGAILGLSHSFFNVLCFRPNTKHRDIKGLYFVGASTHPGTGVPVCLAGGKIVSKQIIDDWASETKSKSSLSSSQIWGPLLLVSLIFVLYNFSQGHLQRQLLTSSS